MAAGSNNPQRIVGRPWPKGVSGNPDGVSPDMRDCIRAARSLSPKAMATLEQLMSKAPPAVRLAAAVAVLNRAYGQPQQLVELATIRTRSFDVSRLTREELAALDVLHQANARLLAEADAGAPGVAQDAVEAPSEGQDRGTPPSGNGGDNGNGL